MRPTLAIDELNNLRQQAVDAAFVSDTPAFVTWRAKVRAVFVRALGQDNDLVARFDQVHYSPFIWTDASPESYFRDFFRSGMGSALGLIDAGLYELRLIASESTSEPPSASPQPAERIIHQTFYINGGTNAFGSTNFSQTQEIHIGRGDEDALTRVLLAANVERESVEELTKALSVDRADNGGVDPSAPGPAVSSWWTKLSLRAGSAGGAVAIGAAGNILSQAIMAYFGMN